MDEPTVEPVAPTAPPTPPHRPDDGGAHVKETLESIIVAFILAFIFRCFVVEAFVIPTGSMAPTLLGAHTRHQCPECGYKFDVNFTPPPRPKSSGNEDDIEIPTRAGPNAVAEDKEVDDPKVPGGRHIVFYRSNPERTASQLWIMDRHREHDDVARLAVDHASGRRKGPCHGWLQRRRPLRGAVRPIQEYVGGHRFHGRRSR